MRTANAATCLTEAKYFGRVRCASLLAVAIVTHLLFSCPCRGLAGCLCLIAQGDGTLGERWGCCQPTVVEQVASPTVTVICCPGLGSADTRPRTGVVGVVTVGAAAAAGGHAHVGLVRMHVHVVVAVGGVVRGGGRAPGC